METCDTKWNESTSWLRYVHELTLEAGLHSLLYAQLYSKDVWWSGLCNTTDLLLLINFLHFVDNKELPENYDKFAKIEPIHAYLPEKFSTLYTPDRDISIDKLLLLSKGCTSWKQYIPSKCVRFVIKFFALCKSKSGYI